MKKIIFTIQVFALIAALPLYAYAEITRDTVAKKDAHSAMTKKLSPKTEWLTMIPANDKMVAE